jgi:hypothetical protein
MTERFSKKPNAADGAITNDYLLTDVINKQ